MTHLRLLAIGALCASTIGACTSWPGGPRPMVDGDGFFDRPWPSDDRKIGGRVDLSGFPHEGEIGLLDAYLSEGEKLTGFGTNSPILLRFEEPLDPETLPTPAESLDPENGLFLVDIDPTSPERGQLIPISWDFQAEETNWQPENLLAIQPVWGMPLRPDTRYALVLTRHRFDRPDHPDGGDWGEVFTPDHPDFAYHQDLQETLFQLHLDPDSIAYATLFTTQDPVSDMARIAWRMKEELPIRPLDQPLTLVWSNPRFDCWYGRVRIPIWQQGEPPYQSEGGGFSIDEEGWPSLVALEEVGFIFTVPHGAPEPEGGWPVVVYSHGTGGDLLSFANSDDPLSEASIYAERGLAGFGISLPFHGDRNTGGSPELLSFNYLNPESGRSTFRQAALEQIWLTHLLTAMPHRFEGPGGFAATTNPERIAYMGHSHGAEIGIMAIPFFNEKVQAVVLSGAGGGLSVSVIERDAGDFPIQTLLQSVLGFAPDEELDTLHPALGLVQFVAEATDPINYARYWHHEQPAWDSAPHDVLAIHGLLDIHTPPSTVGALAGASRTPILAPVGQTWPVQEFVSPGGQEIPQDDNVTAWDGSRVTAGVLQYPAQDHFAVFQDPAAAAAYGDFLKSALEGEARVETR